MHVDDMKFEEQFEKISSQIPLFVGMVRNDPPMQGATQTGRAGQLPLPLAMAYIPPQKWTTVYDDETALRVGTIFPALNLPFEGADSR